MNKPLATSAFFSMGVHLLVLLPLGLLPSAGSPFTVDVVRGTSSVELELVTESEPVPPLQVEPAPLLPLNARAPQPDLDEGVTADWTVSGLKNDPPRYPWVARAQGWEGTLIVRARVGPEGRVMEIAVRKGSGHAILDRAALETIRGWTFQPAKEQGRAKASWVEIPVSFRLQTETKGERS